MTMETPPGMDCSGIGQAQGRCHIQLSRLRRASRRFIWLLRLGRLIRATSSVMTMLFCKTSEISGKYFICKGHSIATASGITPLEHAAINGCCRVVALLFPVTSRIASFPDWSIKGVMEHVHSGEARVQVA
ncbi:hypothetical protein OROMI_019551 [Orobanche minor]